MGPPSKVSSDQYGKIVLVESGKAIIEFLVAKRPQRALLIAKSANLYHKGQLLSDVRQLDEYFKVTTEQEFVGPTRI